MDGLFRMLSDRGDSPVNSRLNRIRRIKRINRINRSGRTMETGSCRFLLRMILTDRRRILNPDPELSGQTLKAIALFPGSIDLTQDY